MYDAVAIGELLVDFTMCGENDVGYPMLSAYPGGAPANFLAAIAKLGGETALIAKVGADAFGRLLLHALNRVGISGKHIVQDEDVFTTLAFVTLDEQGNREFSFARRPGADTRLNLDEIEPQLLKETRIFYFGTTALTEEPQKSAIRRSVAVAKQYKKTIVFDPNLRKPLWKNLDDAREAMLWGLQQADIIKISEEEVLFLFGSEADCFDEAVRRFRDYCPAALCFITLGENGCRYLGTGCDGTVPIPQGLEVVDTTGAGDIFAGSAVWEILQQKKELTEFSEKELRKITQFACVAASLSTTRAGGLLSVPAREQVDELVKAAFC